MSIKGNHGEREAGGAQARNSTPLGSWSLLSIWSLRRGQQKLRQARVLEFQRPEDALTFTPFQLVDICTSLLEVPADVLNFLPDTANLEEGFESDLVQAKEDCRDDD